MAKPLAQPESFSTHPAEQMNELGCAWEPCDKSANARLAGKSLIHARLEPKGRRATRLGRLLDVPEPHSDASAVVLLEAPSRGCRHRRGRSLFRRVAVRPDAQPADERIVARPGEILMDAQQGLGTQCASGASKSFSSGQLFFFDC